jgi:hypothetical protein
MVKRTGRSFTPYDARALVEQIERAGREVGAWQAKVPIDAPIYVALRAYGEAARLLADTARGDIGRPIGTPSGLLSGQP